MINFQNCHIFYLSSLLIAYTVVSTLPNTVHQDVWLTSNLHQVQMVEKMVLHNSLADQTATSRFRTLVNSMHDDQWRSSHGYTTKANQDLSSITKLVALVFIFGWQDQGFSLFALRVVIRSIPILCRLIDGHCITALGITSVQRMTTKLDSLNCGSMLKWLQREGLADLIWLPTTQSELVHDEEIDVTSEVDCSVFKCTVVL